VILTRYFSNLFGSTQELVIFAARLIKKLVEKIAGCIFAVRLKKNELSRLFLNVKSGKKLLKKSRKILLE
jgi:hypothetical protein